MNTFFVSSNQKYIFEANVDLVTGAKVNSKFWKLQNLHTNKYFIKFRDIQILFFNPSREMEASLDCVTVLFAHPFLHLSSDSTTATTSGKLKASCSTANAAPPCASTPRRPWCRCRPTARRRTSSSPAHHPTPALPTVPPAPHRKPSR